MMRQNKIRAHCRTPTKPGMPDVLRAHTTRAAPHSPSYNFTGKLLLCCSHFSGLGLFGLDIGKLQTIMMLLVHRKQHKREN